VGFCNAIPAFIDLSTLSQRDQGCQLRSTPGL